jgi:hypothetical protein
LAYITINHILPHIPMPELIDAFDDDGGGKISLAPGEAEGGKTLLDLLLEDSSQQVDGLIAGRYPNLPFPDGAVPVAAMRAAHDFACEEIYRRRHVLDESNPFKKSADDWRNFLRAVGNGQRQLDANTAIDLQANSGGQPYVPGRIPPAGSPTNY